ncbi:baseplate J/gp47 family protein [Clostridium sp. AN503]|uniref:baseplate J/gp47 family protein n=1 Tax=Clostridium sp. AN503 TaxID=3160598 RepID=UPI0034597323
MDVSDPLRESEKILEEIRQLALSYTPDWRFAEDLKEPGSVIAALFAGLLAESEASFGQFLLRNREEFFKLLGMCPREGERASGEMTFGLVKPDMPDAVVPEKTVVLAGGPKGQTAYELLEAVYVVGNRPGRGRVRALQTGSGGNLPEGTGYKLERSAGFVSEIANPLPLTGGADQETLETAIKRCGAALRHQYRAVTPGDYESLVRELCQEVVRVRCFPGYDGGGGRYPGAVTVAVLQKGRMGENHYYYGKTAEIQAYLYAHSGAMVRENGLFVVLPEFIRMDVSAELLCLPGVAGSQAKRLAKEALEHFLDPVDGGVMGEGWSFGGLPSYGQIKTCLQQVPGISQQRRITVEWKWMRDGQWEDVLPGAAKEIPWTLPVSGQHRLRAIPFQEEGEDGSCRHGRIP